MFLLRSNKFCSYFTPYYLSSYCRTNLYKDLVPSITIVRLFACRPWEADVCSPVACTPTIVRSTSNSTVDESQDTNGHDNAVCHNLHGPAETVDTNHSHGVPEHLLRPDDVRAWSVDHVRDWLLEEGFSREAEAFSQQEIDGACLLLMKRMDVLTELGIKLGPAVKIYERIKRLQSRCTSPTVLGV
ncbi:hypothetical protein AHF37_11989 [Paragonimus kellicotti]|nr:hypothetical protein AHF37_11989 [Paragonimus kellicotti]